MKSNFKIVPDKYYRGNGRWAKVVRLHNKSTVEYRGCLVDVWTPYWSCCIGREGEVKAFLCEDFKKSFNAHQAAKDYIAGLI